jgi:hypothetical protein
MPHTQVAGVGGQRVEWAVAQQHLSEIILTA